MKRGEVEQDSCRLRNRTGAPHTNEPRQTAKTTVLPRSLEGFLENNSAGGEEKVGECLCAEEKGEVYKARHEPIRKAGESRGGVEVQKCVLRYRILTPPPNLEGALRFTMTPLVGAPFPNPSSFSWNSFFSSRFQEHRHVVYSERQSSSFLPSSSSLTIPPQNCLQFIPSNTAADKFTLQKCPENNNLDCLVSLAHPRMRKSLKPSSKVRILYQPFPCRMWTLQSPSQFLSKVNELQWTFLQERNSLGKFTPKIPPPPSSLAVVNEL